MRPSRETPSPAQLALWGAVALALMAAIAAFFLYAPGVEPLTGTTGR